ncbi:MAG TPA: ABC transporter permease [Candidatus Binatia bacterium]|nr:ABC transporter permease [Candidatus Binatia bacterium]
MSLRRSGAIALRILQQFRHDRRTLVLVFVAPILILGLFYYLIRGGSSVPAVDVVNLDRGTVGAAMVSHLQTSTGVAVTVTDEGQAQSDLSSDRVAAYIVLPANLTASAAAGGSLTPAVHLEGTQPGLTQPVLDALNQAEADLLRGPSGTSGSRLPSVTPSITFLHGGPGLDTLDYFGGAFVGLVVFFLVFVVTIIAFLRERSQGTLERLMASPLRRSDVVAGYMAGFMAVAALQAVEIALFTLYALHVHNQGNVGLIVLMTLLLALVAVNLGILLSMFATTEFQAVQFIPLAIVPQVLLSGIVFPVSSEPAWLQRISELLPLTYGVDGLRQVMLVGAGFSGTVLLDLGVVLAFAVALIGGAATTLRRSVA